MSGTLRMFVLVFAVAFAAAPTTTNAKTAKTAKTILSSRPLRALRSNGVTPPAEVLTEYCMTCHNGRTKAGGLALDALNAEDARGDAATWEKVVRKIRTGMMPPSGARRPERIVLDTLAAELETRLDRAAGPVAGLDTPALHRLNRTEYANAIRDLVALDVDVATLLPSDASSDGFDNIADALAVSPSLVQGYVSAAMKLSRRAIGDRTAAPSQTVYNVPGGLSQDRHIEGLPLGTRGGLLVRHTFPLDAEYDFRVSGGLGIPGAGLAGATLDVTLDGERVPAADVRNFRMAVTAGPHTIGAALVEQRRPAGVDEAYSDFRNNATFTASGGVQSIAITGPFNVTGTGDTPSRRQIFICTPARAADEAPCARKIVGALARRAYRRPLVNDEIETLMIFYQQGRQEGDFETGIQHALARILVAPAFLYRAEQEPRDAKAGAAYRISPIELASRLSFFLWSSIPDDELLDAATKGRLRDPQVLQQQVKRMLADARSEALTRNFAGQWLYLRELAALQTGAKDFDENLRRAFQRETEMLFATIVSENRSLVDLIDADYTFVDERLARHYGIPDVHGSYFRRVALDPSSPRRGLLGQGSMLTVTSVSTRTSPVIRGRWILENLLGTPAPVPPPGVDTNLEKDAEAMKATSLRQRLEAHRSNLVCSSCHRIMDPIGLSLENFDLIGAWRERDGRVPIDASGQLVDGTALRGPSDLRAALLARRDAFVTNATERMFTYALGRPVQYDDMPAVRAILRASAANGYRFSSIVMGIIESSQFQMRIASSQMKMKAP